MHRAAALVLFALLAGCGSSEPGPGGVTANEAAALDDAAEMIEGQRLGEDALQPQAPPAQAKSSTESPPPAK